jgi:replicative DNA helicase
MVRSIEDMRATARNRPARAPGASAGRVPPHNTEAEESLIGAMLLSRDAIGTATEICSAEDFYSPGMAIIFDAIVSLDLRGAPVDPVTVADELGRQGRLEMVGGPGALSSLASMTPALANVERYARIVEEYSLLRKLIGAAAEIAELGYSVPEDVTEAIDQAESMIFKIADRRGADTVRSIYELLGESMDLLETLYDRSSAITGVPTGFHDLDRLLAGLQPSSLVIIGARPAMGKTSLALSMATHAAKVARVPTLVFSLEMSHMEITQRILSAEARVDATHLRTGSLSEVEWHQVQRAVGHLGEAPIFVDDNPHLTVMDVRAKARRLKASENLGLVVIDYLQLMSGRHSAENRQVEISEISRGLKILARELSVPVVALSQLSRNLENRSDKRPVLADLRESGSLEQDADVVMFIYRDEVYNPETAERGMAELLISKHRNGPTGAVQLVFHDKFARFANMARP